MKNTVKIALLVIFVLRPSVLRLFLQYLALAIFRAFYRLVRPGAKQRFWEPIRVQQLILLSVEGTRIKSTNSN